MGVKSYSVPLSGDGMQEVNGLSEKREFQFFGVPKWMTANQEIWIFGVAYIKDR
jgi:hypothetical protein